jgi:hypothetical protein
MRVPAPALLVLLFSLNAGAGFAQTVRPVASAKTSDSLIQQFFSAFDLSVAAETAELRLHRAPNDAVALLARMETAELQERPEVVLDSALRLCVCP